MRKAYILLLALGLLALSLSAVAQKNGSIKGVAFDTLARQAVGSATISVLDKKDSSLVTFNMTDNNGQFELKGIPFGQYRLLISHVNYHNNNLIFNISDSNRNVDLGNIAMSDKNKVLQEVVVTNEDPPITMINDTVQYNAGSFKTAPNANVEQLLKKLPGVKVDKDGTVTAQGEKVNRVLVDGKEFFGNDPKIATKNLPADAVDKVQVYDKQSDQAQLTGFEDGNYEKTINLKLKKDKKKGVFGKITAGAGNKERFEGKFNINSFKGARQLSAIGMGNNTNAEGFSFMDMLNFTGALSQLRQGAGGGGGMFNLQISGDDAMAMGMNPYGRNGVNTTWGGGLNYNNIIGNKLDWQSNYFYSRFNPSSRTHTFRQNIFKDATTFNDEYSYSNSLTNSNRLNLNLLYQIDSFHSLRFVPSFSYQTSRTKSGTDYRSFRDDGTTINEGFSDNVNNNAGYTLKNDLIFRKKFRHKGRTLSLSLQTSLNASDGDGSLYSSIGYHDIAGNLIANRILNQQNTTESDVRGYSVRAVYTEPLWKKSLLELSAGKSDSKSKSEKITYNYNDVSRKYDIFNDSLSNNFENTYGYTNVGARIRTQRARYNYSVGVTWQKAELEGMIISGIKDSMIEKTFRNLLPNASFKYNFSRFKSLTLNYSTNTNQPSMSQLQPVPDVTNPLYIREGNPDLKQEYSHAFRTNLNLLSPYKNKNFFFFFTLMTTQNKIVNYDSVNLATGVRRSRPINVNGVYSLNSSISYSLPVRALKATLELSTRSSYNHTKQFVNRIGNIIKALTIGPEIRLDMNPNDKINIGLGSNFNYNKTNYSVQSVLNTTYISQEYNTSVDWQLPQHFFLSTDFTYTINSRRAAGFNTNIPMWNASISKQFLKFNRGELKLSAYDLLNRNVSITRTSNQNYIEDREVNTIRQYFLVSFTYSLNKSGLNAGAGGGGVRMIMR
jgi:hypothetical protein